MHEAPPARCLVPPASDLARHDGICNGIDESVRDILSRIAGVELVEPAYWTKVFPYFVPGVAWMLAIAALLCALRLARGEARLLEEMPQLADAARSAPSRGLFENGIVVITVF